MSHENDNSYLVNNIQHEMFRLQDEVNKVFHDCVGAPQGFCGYVNSEPPKGYGMGVGMHQEGHNRPSFSRNVQFPLLSVKDEQKQLTIYADLPGVKKENVKLEVSQGRLTISGTRQREQVTPQSNVTWFMDERFYGHFTRAVRLPRSVNESQISARFVDGVLQISIPTEVVASRTITIA